MKVSCECNEREKTKIPSGDHVKSPLVIPAVSCALVTPVVVPVIKKRTTANGNVRTMANKPACSSWSIVKKRVCELFIFSVHLVQCPLWLRGWGCGWDGRKPGKSHSLLGP